MIVATLVQAVFASGIFILLPLLFLGRCGPRTEPGMKRSGAGRAPATLLYFGLIGLAFMLMEMALLPKFTFLLAHPIYSAAAVLSSVLVFAGCGSLSVRSVQARWGGFLWVAGAGLFFWVGFMALFGERLFAGAVSWPLWARFATAVGLSGFPAFFLGWPFPAGLRATAKHSPGLVPWAWGVNGCASVLGAVIGKLLSISFGFQWTTVAAFSLYLGAIAVFYGSVDRREDKS